MDGSMAKARSLSQFQQTFSDEAHCAAFLFERRWPDGFVCPGCGARRAAALRSRAYTFECLDCGRQTSITAGTVMHRSKLPLTTWFWSAHLMATHSNRTSARQLEYQLGVTYKTASLLMTTPRRRKTASGMRQDCGPPAPGAGHNQPINPAHQLHLDEPGTTG